MEGHWPDKVGAFGLGRRAMIRNENEYQQAVRRLEQARKRLEETGLTADEVKRVLDPMRMRAAQGPGGRLGESGRRVT